MKILEAMSALVHGELGEHETFFDRYRELQAEANVAAEWNIDDWVFLATNRIDPEGVD